MDTENKKTCRLCLKLIYNNFTRIDEIITQMLDVLILKPDLEISLEPVMCSECEKNLQKSFDLKMVLLKRLNKLIPIINHEETVEHSVNIFEDHNVKCQFCLNFVTQENLVRLFETKENMFLVHTLKKHILELDSIDLEQFLTCEHCVEDFQTVFNFIWKCSNIEDKIKNYIEIEGIEIKGQLDLCEVQKFTVIPVLKDEINYDYINEFGIERTIDGKMEITVDQEIKNEDTIEVLDAEMREIENGSSLDTSFKHKCNECTYKTDTKRCLDKHTIIHKDESEVKWHKCMQCPFQTKYKGSLKQHSLLHKNPLEVKMYQCDLCSFGTKHKSNLIKHEIIHKEVSELTVYKCDKCTFETKYANSMGRHKICHKTDHAIVYQCDECMFMTNNKYSLKIHTLRHKGLAKSKSDQKFSCDICLVELKCKRNLKLHMMTHASSSQKIPFKCTSCSFRTKFEQKLKQHVLYHENPSKVTVYKCEECSYENISKTSLRHHINTKHLRRMHKCRLCPYETLYTFSLKNHEMKHKDPSEIVMYKCDWCLYKSNKKATLKTHMLTHRICNPIFKNAYD